MGLAQRDLEYHCYADYCSWPDDVRYELIDGVAYAMGPAPLRVHQKVLFEIGRQVADILEGKPCEVYLAPFDVRLPKADEADDLIDTVVQPDLSVICDPMKLDRRGCRGAPDWVVEVLSRSTARHDQMLKRRVYERAGVKELWLVHPGDRIVLIYRLDAGRYGAPDVFELKDSLPVGIMPDIVIDWAKVTRGLPEDD
jgi:Uma2 family endonuclease